MRTTCQIKLLKLLANRAFWFAVTCLASLPFFGLRAQSCKASFTWSNDKGLVTFTNTSIGDSAAQYEWNFAPSSDATSTDKNPTFSYETSGIKHVFLSVMTGDFSCYDYIEKEIEVTGTCFAKFYMLQNNEIAQFTSPEIEPGYTHKWDFGDGTTSTESDPFHTFNAPGTYNVCHEIANSAIDCKASHCMKVVVTGENDPEHTIYGQVSLGDTTAMPDETVLYLFRYDDSTETYIGADTTFAETNKEFTFYHIKPGKYLVKAAPSKSSAFYKLYARTYHASALKWKDAEEIIISSSSYNASVELRRAVKGNGKGKIGGKITLGAMKKEGDPVKDVEVLLIDAFTGKLAAFAYSDDNGAFHFSGLPMGTYEVYSEITGLPTKSSLITLTESNPANESVVVSVTGMGVTTGFKTDHDNIFITASKIYPNPARADVTVELTTRSQAGFTLTVIDCLGRNLYTEYINPVQGQVKLTIPSKEWQKGIYMIRVSTGEMASQYKFIKQ